MLHLQVLSESVSKALTLTGGSEVAETAHFINMMDKFFDTVNVSNYTNGIRKRKPFQHPYRSGKDFRLKVNFHIFKINNYISKIRFLIYTVA